MASGERRQIRLIVGDLDRFTEKVVLAVVLEANSNIQEDTPVDTGWARANWIPYIGLPIEAPAFAGERAARAAMVPGQVAAQVAAAAALGSYRLSMGSVFIVNNVPYIIALNDGSSSKAPAAFVQAAIRRAVDTVQRRFS